MSALLTEGLGNGTFNGSPQRVLLEGLFPNPVEALPVNYYTQFYYMLLTGNNDAAVVETMRHAVIYGQSLSLGFDPLEGEVISAPNTNHRMFNEGVRAHFNHYAVNTERIINPDNITSLVNLAEELVETNYGETFASGMALKLTDKLYLFSATGRSSYKIDDLSRLPAVTSRSVHFINTIATAIQAQELASASSLAYAIPFVVFKQGTADALASIGKATYKSQALQLIADLRSHLAIATNTRTDTMPIIVDQLGWQVSGRTFGEIAVASIELHRESGGAIICAGPTYSFPYYGSGDPHFESPTYRNYGEKLGLVADAGRDWNPCYITAVTRSGTTITATVHVPSPPLVLDTTLVSSISNSGFVYTGATITGVTITSTGMVDNVGQIAITIDADAGGQLRYAYENGGNSKAGPTLGPRGNVRDSATAVTEYDATPLYNWLCVDDWTVV